MADKKKPGGRTAASKGTPFGANPFVKKDEKKPAPKSGKKK